MSDWSPVVCILVTYIIYSGPGCLFFGVICVRIACLADKAAVVTYA